MELMRTRRYLTRKWADAQMYFWYKDKRGKIHRAIPSAPLACFDCIVLYMWVSIVEKDRWTFFNSNFASMRFTLLTLQDCWFLRLHRIHAHKNKVKPEKCQMNVKRNMLNSLENSHYEFALCLAQTNLFGTGISTLLVFMLVKHSQVLQGKEKVYFQFISFSKLIKYLWKQIVSTEIQLLIFKQ